MSDSADHISNTAMPMADALPFQSTKVVPLYVLYPAADPLNPVVLPELLTESILVDALKKLP
jgi:hypothetical protein